MTKTDNPSSQEFGLFDRGHAVTHPTSRQVDSLLSKDILNLIWNITVACFS